MGIRSGGQNGHFPPGNWGLGTKNFHKPEVSNLIPITWFNSCKDGLFGMTLTLAAQEPGSLIWCYAVMRLQFTHVCSFACRGRLRNLRADCSTVGLYCVTVTWQRIFKCLRKVAAVGVLPHVTVEGRHLWPALPAWHLQWQIL